MRQPHLHPQLVEDIARRLEGHTQPLPEPQWSIWSLFLEIEADKPSEPLDFRWSGLRRIIEKKGWTTSTFRRFERVFHPRLAVDSTRREKWPDNFDTSTSAHLKNLVGLQVKLPSLGKIPKPIPTSALPRVFRIIRRALEKALDLLEESNPYFKYEHLPAIEPESDRGDRYLDEEGIGQFFLAALPILDQLLEHCPAEAREEIDRWPAPDRFLFDKLRIYVWTRSQLFSGDEVAVGISQLDSGSFWDSYLERELLHLLRDRWADLNAGSRLEIEKRILIGRPHEPNEDPEDFGIRQRALSSVRLGWMERNGCKLSEPTAAALKTLRALPKWREEWEIHADSAFEGGAGYVEKISDPELLLEGPTSEVVARARLHSGHKFEAFEEYVPFEGLVERRPRRALLALAHEARHRRFPEDLWRQLLEKWPASAGKRAMWLLTQRLTQLPAPLLFELRGTILDWMNSHLAQEPNLRSSAFDLWDSLFANLLKIGGPAFQSFLGDISEASRPLQTRMTLDHAINAPAGKLVNVLFKILSEWRRNDPTLTLPPEISSRLDQALLAPGEGAGHAVCCAALELSWLYSVDTDWTTRSLLLHFSLGSPQAEAAWRGLLFPKQVPQDPALFHSLKTDFLALFEHRSQWLEEDRLFQKASHFLIVATFWRQHDRRYLSKPECRQALRAMGDEGRQAALWSLARIFEEQDVWESFGHGFFRDIWPQEVKYQTGKTSDAMTRIATQNPTHFPQIVSTLREYLVPGERPDSFLFRSQQPAEDSADPPIVEQWPEKALEVADRIVSSSPHFYPYNLSTFLTKVAEAAPHLRTTRAWLRLYDIVHG